MVQTGESGLGSYVGDRVRGRLQKLLCMADSNPQDFVKNRTLKFVTKSPFQGSPRPSAVGDDIVDRQIASLKILLDVAERISDVTVFDGKSLGAFSGYNSLGRDSLRQIWWALTIHESIEERCRLVCHPFEIVPDARERHLHAIANHRVVIHAKNGDLVRNSYSGFDTSVYDVRGDAVVVAKNAQGITQGANCMDHPPAAQSPIDVPAQASAAPSVYWQQSHTIVPS